MQISIETNVTSQFAEGYGKYYAKYMQNLHVRIVMTVFLVVIAIPSIYFQELPDPGSDFQEYVFDVMLLGIMLSIYRYENVVSEPQPVQTENTCFLQAKP